MHNDEDGPAVAAVGEAADLFRENLALIDRVTARICRHAGLRDADADDFASVVKLALIDNDYAVIRGWQKKSSLATYLTVIVQRLLFDERSRARGRWEPSAAARRGGAAAIALETAVCRDGRPFEQALPIVQAIDPALTVADAKALLAILPDRLPRPRQVALVEAESVAVQAPDSPDAALLADEAAQLSMRATAVVRRALGSMTAEERTIVRCRFGSGMSIADISRMLRLPQRPLYRQLESIISRLRRELVASGIDRSAAESLIDSSIAALDFGLGEKRRSAADQYRRRAGGYRRGPMTAPKTYCPSAETIAMIAEGKLTRRELSPYMEHIAECVRCRTELARAAETLHEERSVTSGSARARWFAAAAAVALIAIVPLVWRWQGDRSGASIATLTQLAPRSARVVEPRLTGGFAWAPYAGALRSSDPAAESARLKLAGAAGEAIDRAERDASVETQHTAGVALILIEKPGDAIERLRAAATKSPNDAALWSDLAAAQYTAALQREEPSLLPHALVSADRAIAIDPHHAEGLFNRALILERVGLTSQARAAWERYLAVDPSSPWAREARARLAQLPVASSDALFRRELPHIERAAAARDRAALEPVVQRWREQSRVWSEAEFLGRWGEAAQRGDDAVAAPLLAIAASFGEMLRQQNGEALLDDAARAIASADPGLYAVLAEGHATYRRGRIALSRQQPSAAEIDLRRSASLFARGGSPMSIMARYYAAVARFEQNDPSVARVALSALLDEAKAHPEYIASRALILWQLSLCHTFDGDAAGALRLLTESAASLRRLDERNNLGFVEALLADAYSGLGRPDDAWAARIRAFDALSRDGRSDRLLINVASAVTAERRAGNRETALALLKIEREVARDSGDVAVRSNTLARGAVLRADIGDVAGAASLVEEAAVVARAITDADLRAFAEANVQFARGAVLLQASPNEAMAALGDALHAYRTMGQRALEVDCHLLLARAAETLRLYDDAAREIENGLAVTERFRVPLAGDVVARGVLDSADELFARAIRLSLDRGNEAQAFAYAERARTRSGDTAEAPDAPLANVLRSRLGARGAALLEIAVLPQESVAFYIDTAGLQVARRKIARDAMLGLARRSTAGDPQAAAELFELFIRPWASRVPETLIVVADPLLDAVPFAALYDAQSQRHLIEQTRVARADGAASLRVAGPRAKPRKAVAVSLPSGARAGSQMLTESAAEAAEIASLYVEGVQLASARSTFAEFTAAARAAHVVHVSGHTRDDGDGGTAALDFAGAGGAAPERVGWRTISTAPVAVDVVVLAACDTLRLPRLTGSRAPSLGGAFLAAGAAEAIGTLRPIGDREARELFRAIHALLANGVAPADAVRRVQMQAISSDGRGPGAEPWSAIAVLTRDIPGEMRKVDR